MVDPEGDLSYQTLIICLTLSPTRRSHPLARFVSDGVSISLNTDDPTVTGSDLVHEHRLTSNATAGIGLQLRSQM
jgi:adenosine deaminase